ncbi:uncharacterized protein isoform X3 [Rhodnius prolixus]
MDSCKENNTKESSHEEEIAEAGVSKESKTQKQRVKKPKSQSALKVKISSDPGAAYKPKAKKKRENRSSVEGNSPLIKHKSNENKTKSVHCNKSQKVLKNKKEEIYFNDPKVTCSTPNVNNISSVSVDSTGKQNSPEVAETTMLSLTEDSKINPVEFDLPALDDVSIETAKDFDLYNLIKNNPGKVQSILKSIKGTHKKNLPKVNKGSKSKKRVLTKNSENSTPRTRRTVPSTPTDRMSRSATAALKIEKTESEVEDSEKKQICMVAENDFKRTEKELSDKLVISSEKSSGDKKKTGKNTKAQNGKKGDKQILKNFGKGKETIRDHLNGFVLQANDNANSEPDTILKNGMQEKNETLNVSEIEKRVSDIDTKAGTSNDKQIQEENLNIEKTKPKIKPGLFSNFKSSTLKFLVNNEKNERAIDKSDATDSVETEHSEKQLSDKLKILDIKKDEVNKSKEKIEETSKRPSLREKYADKMTKVTRNEEEHVINTNEIVNSISSHAYIHFSDSSKDLTANCNGFCKSDKNGQGINNENSYLSNVDCPPKHVEETSGSTSSFSEYQNDTDDSSKRECLNKNPKENAPEQSTPQLPLGKKCKKVLDVLNADSDSSSDSGNFKRNGKISNNLEINKEVSSDEGELASSMEKLQSVSERMPGKYNEESLSSENGPSSTIEAEQENADDELNGPVTPEESLEEAFWDYESEEDETLEKTDVEYTVNDANVEPNCANDESIDNSFIFRDTDDQMSSELSDENDFDDDVEDDLGVSINCEFDDSEKGFHIMEKVCSVFRVPRYYVKRDPDPSEIIEVSEVENESEIYADNRRKIGESLSRWDSADFSSIVSYDIAHDILQNFCPYAFLDGVCKNYNNCVFPHKIPQEILLEHPFDEVWAVLQFMVKQMNTKMNISHQFIDSLILYLEVIITTNKGDMNKIIERTLMVTAYIPFVEDDREVLWIKSLNNLLKLGISRWIAIKQMFRYLIIFFSKNLKQTKAVWEEMLQSLEVDKLPKKVWEVIECLVEPCEYVLPTKFLTAAIVDVANYDSDFDEDGSDSENQFEEGSTRKSITAYNLLVRQLLMNKPHRLALIDQHELHVFLEKACAISDLVGPVSRIRQMIAFGGHLITKFPCRESFSEGFSTENLNISLKRSQSVSDIMELVKKKKVENLISQKPVFEEEKMVSALKRALEVTDLDGVIKILRENINKVFYLNLINQLSTHLKDVEAIPIIKHLLSKINKDVSNEGLIVKRNIGRIIITLMLEFVKITDWEKANTLLMLLHAYKLNPITLETLVGECSQVRKAVICSEIHYHSAHYSSALKVLINYKLFKRENWKLKGDESDIVIVERIANYLLKKLIEKKEYEHAIILFKAIFQELGEDQGEIDLMNFYEELLHGLFEESEKYARTCTELYWSVNEEDPTIALGAVTFRALLILAFRLGKLEIAYEIAEKCMQSKIYPCFLEKERIIRLYKCFLEEEIEVYLSKWFTWFLSTKGKRSCPIKILFLNDSSEDLAMNSRFGMPSILKQIDSTMKGALIRVQNVLLDLCHHTTSALKIQVKKDGIILPAETTLLILNCFQEK